MKAILIDCGDTLVDEATEVRDERGDLVSASLIPGASALVYELVRRGVPIGLVADGRDRSFRTALGPLYAMFHAHAISELVGVQKPHELMFLTALEALRIGRTDYESTMMVGNNLERDIRGANALGLVSVWIDWAPRRSKVPQDELEVPRFTIKHPLELLDLL